MGGVEGSGVIYRLSPSGQQTVLYTFTGGNDGGIPGDVIIDPAGNVYGSTYGGGTAGFGVVYEVGSSGQESVLYSFPGGPGGALGGSSLYRDREGDLYGTTIAGGGASYEAGGGVVFELDTEGNYTVLYRFTGGAGVPLEGDAGVP